MHKNLMDLTGRQFGKLTVLRDTGKRSSSRQPIWLCACKCGVEVERLSVSLVGGKTKSCGCEKLKHGHAITLTSEYMAWKNMIQRCDNPKHPSYPRYGGRGISIHMPWRKSFTEFLDHIGPKPYGDFSVDRIDNESGYFPGNVKWSTRSEQQNNRSEKSKSAATLGKEP